MNRVILRVVLIPLICIILVLGLIFSTPAAGNDAQAAVTVDVAMPAPAAYIFIRDVPLAAQPSIFVEETSDLRHRDDIVYGETLLSYELQELMQDIGEMYDVPYALLLAIAETESGFNADAVSATNDYGLMQINKGNHEWLLELGIDPLTPAGNIEAGAYILSQHLQQYSEVELALMAYNCGATGAKKLWNSGVYQTNYSQKVMTAFEHWTAVLEE